MYVIFSIMHKHITDQSGVNLLIPFGWLIFSKHQCDVMHLFEYFRQAVCVTVVPVYIITGNYIETHYFH